MEKLEDRKSIKEMILKLYPNATFKNEYFLTNKVLVDFSLEDIAFKLSQLDNDSAWYLNHVLYYVSFNDLTKEMLFYLVHYDFSYFNNLDGETIKEKIYDFSNLLKEYEKIYGGHSFSLEDFKSKVEMNEKNNKDKSFLYLDIHYLDLLIMVKKMYKEKNLDINELKKFTSFQADLLNKDIVDECGNYNQNYEICISEVISYLISGKISLDTYFKIMSHYNQVVNLLIYAKFGISDYHNDLSLEIVDALNSKKVKRIYQMLIHKELQGFRDEKLMKIVMNMFVMLGENNVDNIVKHLPNDERKMKRLLDCFLKLDISKVEVLDRKIVYHQDFINFFMGNNLREPNSLLNLIYEGKTSIGDYLDILFSHFDNLNERYKNQKLLTRTAFFENILKESKVFFNPDEYQLEGDIINSYFDNKKHQQLSPVEFTNGIREVYEGMKHNYQKTIPYVCGELYGYFYETLKANDPSIFIMGAKTNCCFKIGGQADSFVRYCANNKNGRVVAIKDENGDVVAMIPMFRNGNLILCNSIESNHIHNNDFMKKMFEILEIIAQELIDISNREEEHYSSIHAVLCGNYKNEISQFSKYPEIDFKNDLEKVSSLENISYNLGMDSHEIFCIKSCDNFNFAETKVFDPSYLYDDPRSRIYELESDSIKGEMIPTIQKRIDAISFESKCSSVDILECNNVIFNDDWYIIIDKKNKIHAAIVGNDPRAFEEYQEYLILEQEYCKYYDGDGKIIEDARYR